MKSFLIKTLNWLVKAAKVITALVFIILLIVLSLNEEVDNTSVYFILFILLPPGAYLLDAFVLKRLQAYRFRLRIYFSLSFLVFQILVVYITYYFAKVQDLDAMDNGVVEGIGGFAVFNALFFMIGWLWWGKIQRTSADLQIIANFAKLKKAKTSQDKHLIALVKSLEILKHRFAATKAGESFREYFPAIMKFNDEDLFTGAHYYDETIKTTGSNPQYISTTARHAFWALPIDLPDAAVKKHSSMDKTFGSIAINPIQRNLVEQLKKLMEEQDFKSLEVSNGWLVLIKTFPMNLAALGEKPYSTLELEQITQQVRGLLPPAQ